MARSLMAASPPARSPNDNGPSNGSRIEFTVERYSFDDKARKEYDKLHPAINTLADLNAKLLNLKSSVEQLKDWLIAVDEIIRQIHARVTESKADRIKEAFAPLESAIDENVATVAKLIGQYGSTMPAPPVLPEVIAEFHKLNTKLANLKVAEDPQSIMKQISEVMKQLQGKSRELDAQLVQAKDAIEKMKLNEKAAQSAKLLIETMLAGHGTNEHRVRQELSDKTQFSAKAEHAAESLQQIGGDLVLRKYHVYQDLSDPFIDYIAKHSEQWMPIANRGLVAGDGDTQFILVFEDQFDGRFNFVSVDPTKVIQARMRIGRQIAQNLVSLAGVATKAFGVPIPTSLASSHGETNSETIDFSKMTAIETQAKLENEEDRKDLDALRKFAVSTIANFPSDPTKAEDIRNDLIRRLQPYLPK